MTYITPLLNILSKSTRNIGKSVLRDFGEMEKLQDSLKNNQKFITNSQNILQTKLSTILKRIRPELEIFENHKRAKTMNCWLIDTVNNELNFSRGLSNFCISAALKEENKVKAIVIYDPLTDENFQFQEGHGGYLNDSRIRVSERKKISDSLVGVYKKHKSVDDTNSINIIRKILSLNSVVMRETGSILLDLCNVGSGKYDCCIFSNPNENFTLMSNLILGETGGFIDTINCKNSIVYVASNKSVGKIVTEILKSQNEK